MRRAGWKFAGSLNTWLSVLAVVAITGTTSLTAARAEEGQAKSLFKAMSDYLAAQQAISFDYDSALEVVTDHRQARCLELGGPFRRAGDEDRQSVDEAAAGINRALRVEASGILGADREVADDDVGACLAQRRPLLAWFS